MGNARAKIAEGIVDLIGASVSKGKSAVEAWKHAPTVNIGLNVNDGSKLDPAEAIDALRKMGVDVTHQAIKQSGTEPTLVARLSRSLTNDEADMISRTLRQDAIAQIDHKGVGELHGPAADNWRPFNKDYFLGLDAEPAVPELVPAMAGGGRVGAAKSLLTYLAAKGGIKDHGGELRHMDLHKRTAGAHGAIVRPGGVPLDTARSMAAQDGYMDEFGEDPLGTTTVEDFLELIRREASGQKIYSNKDLPRTAPVDLIAQEQSEIDALRALMDEPPPFAGGGAVKKLLPKGVEIVADTLRGGVLAKKNGKNIAQLTLQMKAPDGSYSAFEMATNPKYRRRGIMAAMHDEAERSFGPMRPDRTLSDDGFEFWRGYRPDAIKDDLRNHREKLLGRDVTTSYGAGKIKTVGSRAATVELNDRGGATAGVYYDTLRQMLKDMGEPGFAEGGAVNKPAIDAKAAEKKFDAQQQVDLLKLFDPDRDIRDYENMASVRAAAPADERSMTHLGPKPRRNMKLETFGTEFDIGDAPYDVAEGMETLADVGYTAARMAPYAMGPIPAAAAAGVDLAEAYATGDPLSAGAAVAFGPGGKLVKAAGTGLTAATMNPDEAEAGFLGKLAKGVNKEALQAAREMDALDVDPETIRQQTGWFRGPDKQWRTERSKPNVKNEKYQSRYPIDLSEIHKDEELFEIYPHLRNWKFNRMNDQGAHVDANSKIMTVGDVSGDFYQKMGGYDGVIAHELDHVKAVHEGWAPGTNLNMSQLQVQSDAERFGMSKGETDKSIASFINTLNKDATIPHSARGKKLTPKTEDARELLRHMTSETYMREPGEMMARNAAVRRDYTGDDIKKIPPLSTLDRPLRGVIPEIDAPSDAYVDMLNYIMTLQNKK